MCKITVEFLSFPGYYVKLNDTIIFDHGHVEMSDIGSTDSSGLHCSTNYSDPGSRGDWIAPDGTRVSNGSVPGFRITRDPVSVRLVRNSGVPPEGIYQCVVENDTAILHTVHLGLYNSGGGMFDIHHSSM